MKAALILVAAMGAPPPQVIALDPGDEVKCLSPDGCIVLTKPAMRQFIGELEQKAAEVCAANRKGWI